MSYSSSFESSDTEDIDVIVRNSSKLPIFRGPANKILFSPLDKVVFIQKVAAFTKTVSLKDLLRLAYVNNSWNDTIKNYAFHIVEQRVHYAESADILEDVCCHVIKSGVNWVLDVLLSSEIVRDRIRVLSLACDQSSSFATMQLVFQKLVEAGGNDLVKRQLIAPNKAVTRWTKTGGSSCLMIACSKSSSPEVMKLVIEKIIEVGGVSLLKSEVEATDSYGSIPLMYCCNEASSPLAVKLFATVLHAVGLFKQEYEKLKTCRMEDLSQTHILRKKAEIQDASWVPDAESVAEVKKMLAGES